MTEDRPPAPDRKQSLVAPMVIGGVIIALLISVLVLDRREAPPAPADDKPPPTAVIPPVAPPVAALAPLTRKEMIQGADAEAAAYAIGAAPARESLALRGRRFLLRLPFGCEGSGTSPAFAQAFVERDDTGKTVRLVASPGAWTTLPLIRTLPQTGMPEAVEGFWVTRPWSYAEACPPRHSGEPPATPTPAATPTLGLARLFDAEGSRLLRRDGRAYEFVRSGAQAKPLGAETYRLVLEGRIATFPGGSPIRCGAETPDHRPICLYAVAFERVAFETADGQTLAEWRE